MHVQIKSFHPENEIYVPDLLLRSTGQCRENDDNPIDAPKTTKTFFINPSLMICSFLSVFRRAPKRMILLHLFLAGWKAIATEVCR